MIVRLKNPHYRQKIQIRPEKHFFLNSKSDCSEKTFYECIGSKMKNSYPIKFDKPGKMNCSKECSFFTFPKMDSYNISACEGLEDNPKKNKIDPKKKEKFIGIRISREAACSVYNTRVKLLDNSTIRSK